MSKSKTKGTKYYGWDNVPKGVLVKAKTFDKTRVEFYVKTSFGSESQCFIDAPNCRVFESVDFDPDEWTTGVYKAMH